MAFIGRGGFPSIEKNNVENNNIGEDDSYMYHGYFNRFYYCMPAENTYTIIEIILVLLLIIGGIVAYFATYKTSIIDPIKNIKDLYINSYLITIGIVFTTTIIIDFITKSANVLMKRLVIVLAVSMLVMLIFSGIKLNLDETYTEDKFGQIYVEPDDLSDGSIKSKIDIEQNKMIAKNKKENYIKECLKLYDIFNAKFYGIIRYSSFS